MYSCPGIASNAAWNIIKMPYTLKIMLLYKLMNAALLLYAWI
jgi:hypothetical protein